MPDIYDQAAEIVDVVQQHGAAVLRGQIELGGQDGALCLPCGIVGSAAVVQTRFADEGVRVAAQQGVELRYVRRAVAVGKPRVDADGGDDGRRGQREHVLPVASAGGGHEKARHARCGGLRQHGGQVGCQFGIGKVGVGVGEHGFGGGRQRPSEKAV